MHQTCSLDLLFAFQSHPLFVEKPLQGLNRHDWYVCVSFVQHLHQLEVRSDVKGTGNVFLWAFCVRLFISMYLCSEKSRSHSERLRKTRPFVGG